MARYERFTFLCDQNERRAISDLAFHLQRSQSDAVRFIVTEAARQLAEPHAGEQGQTCKPAEGQNANR